ncbi:MAG: ureidoglycolate lyase [Rhodospirillaceae bacterium]
MITRDPTLLQPEPLSAQAFAPYGTVIETEGVFPITINEGFAKRYDDLARVPVGADGETKISLFRAEPRPMPIALTMMERHPLSAQAFLPMVPDPWLVVVADPDQGVDRPGALRAFLALGHQGVVYHPGVWHHPLLVLRPASLFLVVDRAGPGANCDEVSLLETGQAPIQIALPNDDFRI